MIFTVTSPGHTTFCLYSKHLLFSRPSVAQSLPASVPLHTFPLPEELFPAGTSLNTSL